MIVIEQGFETEMTDLVVDKSSFYTVNWTVGFGGSISAGGVIKDDIIYFGCCDNYIYAVSLKTAKEIWRFKASGSFVESRPFLNGNFLYLGCYDGHMYKVDIRTGKLAWRFKTGEKITASANVQSGVVYISSFDGNFYAVDDREGKEIWRFRTGNWTGAGPLIIDGIMYAGSGDGNLYALNISNGIEMWRFRTGGSILHHRVASFHGNVIFFPSSDHYLYAVDMKNGKELWKFRTGERTESTPLIHEGVVYFGTHDNNFYALDMKTGKELWRFRTENWIGDIRPLIQGNLIYFGSVDGNMYALTSKGKLVWKFRTGGEIWADAVYWNGLVIFGSWDCHLYALEAKTGKEAWRFETSSKMQSSLEIFEQVKNKPEFVWAVDNKKDENEKYDFIPQLNVSESFYTPAIEYAGRDVYGAGKKKYDKV